MTLLEDRKRISQNGQTLVVIIMLMSVALLIGITVSDRFIAGLKNIVSSDDSSKALAIAEAAIEKVLLLSNETLEDYINFGNCGSDCYLEIADTTGELLTAEITLSLTGSTSEPYILSLIPNDTKQVSISGYPTNSNVDICWNGEASIFGMYIYENSGKVLAKSYAYNPISGSANNNGFSTASSAYGYQNCFSIATTNTPKLIRIKSFYANATVFVLPASGQSLPTQGIVIQSVGSAGNAKKTVIVIKTTETLSGTFDYALFQKSQTDPLSN